MRQQSRPSPKEEAYLDSELAKLGVKPRITHLKQPVDCYFRVITVATPDRERYSLIRSSIKIIYRDSAILRRSDVGAFCIAGCDKFGVGSAFCHYKDNFDRRKGRVIAKRRLLNILKEEKQ